MGIIRNGANNEAFFYIVYDIDYLAFIHSI